jgi:magnesium transporter
MSTTDVARDSAISLRQAIHMQNAKAIELWLDVVDDPAERAYQLSRLSSADRHRLGDMLTVDVAPKLLEAVDVHLAAKIIKSQPTPRAAELLAAVDPQHAVKILRRYQPDHRDALLTAMPIDQARIQRAMLLWRPDSVAAHMTTETLTVDPPTTAEEAVDQIRHRISAQPVEGHIGSCVYVTGPDHELLGAVPLRSLVLAKADRAMTDLMADDVVTVNPLTSAEDAAHLCLNRRLEELAVVDGDRRLLGILTEDQAVDIVADETTEDAEKQGGSTPLEVPYLRASPWRLWRKRIIWLLVLFVAEAYTGTVLRAFEDEMEAVVALAFFIPLLIGTGGNTGTQITTTLVRAMGTGQVRFRDLPAVVAKEMSTGTLIAVAMAIAAMIRAWTLGVGPQIALTVTLTVAAIVMWSALVSSILPLVLKKIRIDPAVVSAPMIATIVDGTGLMIYFVIAHATLPQLAGL